jgi:hypothetical protein
MKKWLAVLVAVGWLALLTPAGTHAEALTRLASLDPWPWATNLVEYDGRLWFVTSVRLKNHPSADLYSYDPAEGTARYERHLFSQDSGRPTVHRGLLYWPSEDTRFSVGWGDLAATNGRDWWWGPVTGSGLVHVQALASLDGRLYAGTSARKASLQASDDGGLSWRTVYTRFDPGGGASRLTELAVRGGDLFMVARDGRSEGRYLLLRRTGDDVAEVPGSTYMPS